MTTNAEEETNPLEMLVERWSTNSTSGEDFGLDPVWRNSYLRSSEDIIIQFDSLIFGHFKFQSLDKIF